MPMTDNVATMIDELLVESPGQTLQQAREQAGLTVREVAEKLHLLPNQVEYLEADQYQRFSGEIFCKGYLKSYGQLLDLNPAPLIEAYLQIRPEQDRHYKAAVKPAAPVQKPGKGHSIQYWCLAVFILVIGFLWLSFDGENEPVAKSQMLDSPVVIDKQIESPQVELVTGIDIQDSFNADTGESDNDVALIMLSAAANTSAGMGEEGGQERVEAEEPSQLLSGTNTDMAAELVMSSHGNNPVNLGIEDRVSQSFGASQEDKLNFSFSKDCWVEVADGSNELIFADLKRSGDTLELTGQPPFKVLLGYAPGVSIVHNGNPVDIDVNRNNNAATLTVGQ